MTETKNTNITDLTDDELDMVSGGVNIPADTVGAESVKNNCASKGGDRNNDPSCGLDGGLTIEQVRNGIRR